MTDEPVMTSADMATALLNRKGPSPEQETEREREYRRGYCDGWIAALDDMYDAMFNGRLSRQKAFDVLWEHWRAKLMEWQLKPGNLTADEPPPHTLGG